MNLIFLQIANLLKQFKTFISLFGNGSKVVIDIVDKDLVCMTSLIKIYAVERWTMI